MNSQQPQQSQQLQEHLQSSQDSGEHIISSRKDPEGNDFTQSFHLRIDVHK